MPWHATRSDQCPADKPWAVIKNDDGEVVACHMSEEDANKQVAALYANEPAARSVPEGQVEKRSVTFSDLELAEDGLRFTGYAAIFGQEADLGEFTEEVQRGAFRNVLLPRRGKVPNVPMLYDHDHRHPPLATTGGKTLRLKEDSNGLRVEADLDEDHYLTPTIRSMIRRGDITGMSFGFIAGAGNSRMEHRGGKPHRILTGFKHLLDVSPTWEPAYSGTSAELRSALTALRMAEALEPSEQILSGTYQQLEDQATDEVVDTDASEAEPTAEQVVGQDEGADEVPEKQEMSDLDVKIAARRRLLRMMELELPPDFRS